MTNDAEAQEIHGTVVSSGRFPEAAAGDAREPAQVARDEANERPGSTGPGYERAAAGRGDDDEVLDPDAVIIDQADETPDADDADDAAAADETPDADNTAADEETHDEDDETDEIPADAETSEAPVDEAPAPMAGFARTPVASPASATADDAVPEADVIAEAARPGVPQEAGQPRDRDVPAVSGLTGDPAQLREQWLAIQSSFVDDPRASVASAAELVSEAIEALVASVQERERGLRGEWERDGADTEDLRNTLRGYRGLLDQLAGI